MMIRDAPRRTMVRRCKSLNNSSFATTSIRSLTVMSRTKLNNDASSTKFSDTIFNVKSNNNTDDHNIDNSNSIGSESNLNHETSIPQSQLCAAKLRSTQKRNAYTIRNPSHILHSNNGPTSSNSSRLNNSNILNNNQSLNFNLNCSPQFASILPKNIFSSTAASSHQTRSFFGGGPFGGGPGGNGNGGQNGARKTKKLYEVLNVSQNASDKEIKSAYKKLAMQTHPDKGGDPEKFKEISKAYDILSNPQKKQMYDMFGDAGLDQMESGGGGPGGMGGGPGGMGAGGPGGFGNHADPFEMFRDIFGQHGMGGGPGGHGGVHGGMGRRPRTADMVQKMRLSLEEIYTGTTKEYKMARRTVCGVCNGTGGLEIQTCAQCGGQGKVMHQQRMGPFIQMVQTDCSACGGYGYTIPRGKECKACNQKGMVSKEEYFKVHIPAGASNGYSRKFENKADESPDHEAGDLIFVVDEIKHHIFHRVGSDLLLKKNIPLQDALCGFRFKVRYLDGEDIMIESNEKIVQPNDVWRIPQRGLPNSNGVHGDLIIKFDIIFPEKVIQDREAFEKLGLDKSFCLKEEISDTDSNSSRGSDRPNKASENSFSSTTSSTKSSRNTNSSPRRKYTAEPMSSNGRAVLKERMMRQAERDENRSQGGGQNCQVM